MSGEREALFNALHDAISQPAWDECTIDMERAAYLTGWLSDAGWRPPPAPQAAAPEAAVAAEDRAALLAEVERLRAALTEDLSYHEGQVEAWSDPEAGDPDERDHHQRRGAVLRAALGEDSHG